MSQPDGDQPDAGQPGARQPRRARTATESLLAAALGMEAVLMIFVGLTAFGLKALPAWAALGGGAAMLLLFVVTAGLVRFRAGVVFSGVLQLALILTGLALPMMWFIGVAFAAFWLWCLVKGSSLERAKLVATHPTEDPE